MQQTTDHIFLVKPAHFGYNIQTARSNVFQNPPNNNINLQAEALKEFDALATTLKANGVCVHIFEDSEKPIKPDAIFPNNWISIHEGGTMVLYPMLAPNRRKEVDTNIITTLAQKYDIKHINDLRHYIKHQQFLEGTGSVVFDHQRQVAYACLSERTCESVFIDLCNCLGYKPIAFSAFDESGQPIYHTNVLMCVGRKFVTICLEAISPLDRKRVVNSLQESGLDIIDINFEQLHHFAGNMLELKDNKNTPLIVLSQHAYDHLSTTQINQLSRHGKLIPISIPTIETIAGGSVRCTIAEIFQ